MSYWELILISIGLAMDASAVSMVASASGYAQNSRAVFRLAFHFGLFQGLMPVLGWLAGSAVVDYISAWDHWVAFILLGLVGSRMIYSGLYPDEERMLVDPSKGFMLITLSIATSIDAFAVGLSFSVLEMSIIIPGITIAIVTLIMSILAMKLGSRVSKLAGHKVEILGGLILIGIGLRILLAHIL